jgi:palmitoyl-protein thioesterase
MKMKIVVACLFITLVSSAYPVALFHGISDSCSNSGMKNIGQNVSKSLGGVYVRCIETGGGINDWNNSFRSQAEKACSAINSDPNFHGDFSIMALSQGSLLGRIVIQMCDMPGRVKRFVSIGGPQMGVSAFPQCTGGIICNTLAKIIGSAVYYSFAQNNIGPAGYFRDMKHYDNYLDVSILAEVNNEKKFVQQYYDRFSSLEKIVLIKFADDTMIVPRETAWFESYDKNRNVVKLEDSEFYKKDLIGLKKLVEEQKVDFVTIPGNHLRFTHDDIAKYMIPALR